MAVRVATIDVSAVRETMGMYLRVNAEFDYGKLHEVRSVLEIEIAGLAAERATAEDLAALERSCDDMAAALDDVEKVSVLDVEFHRLIAQAAHNSLFLVMLDSIGDILLDVRRATMGIRGRPARVRPKPSRLRRGQSEPGPERRVRHHRAVAADDEAGPQAVGLDRLLECSARFLAPSIRDTERRIFFRRARHW